MRGLRNLLSSAGQRLGGSIPSRGIRSPLPNLMRTLNTPVTQLSNRAKYLTAAGGLGAGAAIGHEFGQPLLEAILHSNPGATLSKAELAALAKELKAGADAKNISQARDYLLEAVAAANGYKPDISIVENIIAPQRGPALQELKRYIDRAAGDTLFPRAAELSGMIAQNSAANLLQDASKAIPVAGGAADISQLVRNLTIVNGLAAPEVAASIRSSYAPILEDIIPKARSTFDDAARKSIERYHAFGIEGLRHAVPKLQEPLHASNPSVRSIARSLRGLHNPESIVKDYLLRVTTIENALKEQPLRAAIQRADALLTQADRGISPAVEYLRARSPGIAIPTDLRLDAGTASSAAKDTIKGTLMAPAMEKTVSKLVAKATGKQIPGLGWALGAGDAVSSAGSNALFSKQISGVLQTPGNLVVNGSYYTPTANTLYKNLTGTGGPVEKLYQRSLDPSAIASTGRQVLPARLHSLLPKIGS